MKKVPEYQFTPEEREEADELARAIGLTRTTAGILYARGIQKVEAARRFLAPSKENFLSPFLMRGMKEAVELITTAKEEGWNVAVFGDYDADGIGALAILFRALKRFGIEPYLYVPERSEGYGMSIEAIDRIFDEFMPDLIITVDCGSSNAREVEYVKEQGAYVIVTDHHELPAEIPDCICINPKFQDEYPYDNLCGAGVAFKLAVALLGEEAYDLLDFCALSTVADSVPLFGENRDIVAEGLRLITENPRPAFRAFLNKTEVTAQTLAFTVAPRINAAGRMGDAHSALRLFISENEEEIALLAEKLNLYNTERQKLCDVLYESARNGIRAGGAYGNVVMAMGEDWHTGLIGIAAARIAEEFSRPALLFVKSGTMLRGSARSVESVNIFEALKACSEYIEEFGGHAQAAGVNVKVENFELLKEALSRYIGEHYGDIEPTVPVASAVEGDDPYRIARELNLLEPFGVGNRRPLFCVDAFEAGASPVKLQSPHLSMTAGGLDLMYFNGAKDLHLLNAPLKKSLIFEYNLSNFRGREYIKGYVRSIVYDGREGECMGLESALTSFLYGEQNKTLLTEEEANAFIEEKKKERYGLLVIAYERETLLKFPACASLPAYVYAPASGNVKNAVLLAPENGADLSAYRDIVYLEEPARSHITGNAAVYALNCPVPALRGISTERDELLSVFAAIRRSGGLNGATLTEASKSSPPGIRKEQMIFALAVFEELGLIARYGNVIRVVSGKKTQLSDSAIYCGVQALK